MSIGDRWRRFVARNICAPDPTEAPVAAEVVAQPAPTMRVIPWMVLRPNGQRELGWRIFAHHDAERAEVIWAAWVLGQRKGVSA